MNSQQEDAFRQITEHTKRQIDPMEVVFPRRYLQLFTDSARELQIDLGAEAPLTEAFLDDQVISHVDQLSANTTKAIDAMETEDRSQLEEVLMETKRLQKEIEQLRSAVYEDTLTKVFNRRWMEEHYLDDDNIRFEKDGTLCMIDLNDFKHVNDTFGHITGDKVLLFIAMQLKRSGGDVVRYGGDEFFVIFDKDISKDKARLRLHNIRELVIKKRLNADGNTFKTSFSYGSAEFAANSDLASIVQVADEEMYEDKIKIKSRLAKAS